MDISEVLAKFEDYLRIQTTSSPATIKKYRSIVRLFLVNTGMKFNLQTINNWLVQKNQEASTSHYRFALRHFLLNIGKKEWAEQLTPGRKMPRQKVFKYVPKQKMNKLLQMLPMFYRRLAFLQWKTGARVTEVMTIRSENIDFEIDPDFVCITIGVNKSKTKGSKERVLRLSKKYEASVKGWIKRPYGYVFLDPKFETCDNEELELHLNNMLRYYNKELKEKAAILGIDEMSSHYLRHLFADEFIMKGGDPLYLQDVLGHARLETTRGYVSVLDKKAKDILKMMED